MGMRPRTGFDATVFTLVGLCLLLVALEVIDPVPWWYYAMAAGGALAILGIYLAFYRPLLPAGAPRPWWVTAALVLSVGVTCTGFTHLMLIQIAAHVLVWATARRSWHAVLTSAAISAAAFIGTQVGELGGTGIVPPSALAGITGLAYMASLGYGFWIRHAQQDANEQARLVEELRATRDALTAASHHAGQMAERARVSRELHDTLTQSVAALALVAAQAKQSRSTESIDLIHEMSQSALAEARGVLSELAPAELHGDAALSLDGVVARFCRETALQIDLQADSLVLDAERELILIRCLQEGLSNVRRHANAQVVQVGLREAQGRAELVLVDDGVGPPADPSPGFGLRGMTERVSQFGGEVSLTGQQGGGARLRILLPIMDDGAEVTA